MKRVLPAYTELHALSHFSFQRGASSPDDMVARAAALTARYSDAPEGEVVVECRSDGERQMVIASKKVA